MSSSAAKTADAPKPHESQETSSTDALAVLGVLEEDDEFEEFPVADWEDDQTDLVHLGGAAPGAAQSGGDKLWEDNWDDDDIEDEFSMQLRNELAKTREPAMEQ